MVRKSFFEILENLEINPLEEVRKIEFLFAKQELQIYPHTKTLELLINDTFFITWKYRKTCLSVFELRTRSKILTNSEIVEKTEITIEEMLLYFEYVVNLIKLIDYYTINSFGLYHIIATIEHNINQVCDSYNFKFERLEDKYVIIENSEIVTNVSELYPDIANKVIEYSRVLLKGDLDKKRELLTSISLKYEGYKNILSSNGESQLIKNIDTLLNNLHIRHNNLEGEHENLITKNMPEEELEEWYDRAYNLMLLALMYKDYLTYNKDIKDLRIKLKSN